MEGDTSRVITSSIQQFIEEVESNLTLSEETNLDESLLKKILFLIKNFYFI